VFITVDSIFRIVPFKIHTVMIPENTSAGNIIVTTKKYRFLRFFPRPPKLLEAA
jgi:hypothetical protein